MDYQGNTNKDKESKEEKKIEKVISGDAVLIPKGIGWKFKNIFLGGTAKQAARYVGAEVLLPALRNLMYDVVAKGSERVIFGDSSFRRPRPTTYGTRVQYNNPLIHRPLDPRMQQARLPDQYRPRTARRDINDIVLASREEADLVVERMLDVLDKYDVVSVGDLYDLLGLESSHIDQKWGWTYLNNVEVRQVRNGYLIELPVLEEI